MVMNFYREQEQARKQEKIMLLLFVFISVLLTIILTKAIDWGYAFVSNRTQDIPDELSLLELLLISILFFSSICTASFYKVKQLSKGNYSSIMTGGILLDDNNNVRAKQLRNTVEEMAISAGIPVPKIYVLENEPSVNAFAAGIRHTDMVVGITRGSLEYLNRDELQGVAAYQMAQIINGYARLNTLIYGVLFGLQFIYSAFSKIYNKVAKSVSERTDPFNIGIGTFTVFFILMIPIFPLWLVAYMGHFSAKMIKSKICRENVFRADATAVQLTRYPNGIASVLQKSLQTQWSYILFADEFLHNLEHLLFTFGNNPIYEFQILHTHPDTQQRIKKILPHWRGTEIITENDAPRPTQDTPFYNQTAVKNVLGASEHSWQKILEKEEVKIIPTLAQNHEMAYDAVATAAVLGIMGGATRHDTTVENEAYWFAAARQPEKASAVVVAMLARHSDNKKACLDIAELFSQELHNNIKNLLEHALPDERRFAVLVVALPNVRLNIIGEENINKYKHFLQEVIKSDDKITLFEHCVYAAVSGSLKMSLMAGFLPPVGKDKLKSEIIELLNLTAQHSNSGHHAEKAFQAALTECGFAQTAYRDNIPLGRLSSLLHTLDRLSFADKRTLMNTIHTIADFDEQRSKEENDWISTLAIAWELSGVRE